MKEQTIQQMRNESVRKLARLIKARREGVTLKSNRYKPLRAPQSSKAAANDTLRQPIGR